jgi:hypothetical protein
VTRADEGPYEEVADIVTAIVRPYLLTYDEWRRAWLSRSVLDGLRRLEEPKSGRLGERCPEFQDLSERLQEVNDRSSGGGLK